jgi:predicted metal-dependent hydrolase
MDTAECKTLALSLMSQYRLYDWKFEFDYHKTRFGLCDYHKRTISMSLILTVLNDKEIVLDTILHEIAHAMTPNHGHGHKWRIMAKAIGCQPRACYGAEVKTHAQY